MIFRVSNPSPEGNNRSPGDPETSDSQPDAKGGLLSARAAAILGASFLIAIIAGGLTYLALGRSTPSLAGAVLAAGTAFAGAIRLLITIIG